MVPPAKVPASEMEAEGRLRMATHPFPRLHPEEGEEAVWGTSSWWRTAQIQVSEEPARLHSDMVLLPAPWAFSGRGCSRAVMCGQTKSLNPRGRCSPTEPALKPSAPLSVRFPRSSGLTRTPADSSHENI